MTQTTTALSVERTLTIHSPSSPLSVSRDRHRTDGFYSTWNDGSFYLPTYQSRDDEQLHISYRVREKYVPQFILIRGLIEFHRPAELQFAYDRENNTFEAIFQERHLNTLNRFLERVAVWVDQEISFKTHLKQILAFEDEYRARLNAIYASQNGTTYNAR